MSTTLTDPEWANTTVISTNVVDELKRLKQEPGQDIVQYGFGSVSKLLLENGMLDELRLWLYPQTVGKGKLSDLFFAHATEAQFDLVDTIALSNGIVIHTYTVAR